MYNTWTEFEWLCRCLGGGWTYIDRNNSMDANAMGYLFLYVFKSSLQLEFNAPRLLMAMGEEGEECSIDGRKIAYPLLDRIRHGYV